MTTCWLGGEPHDCCCISNGHGESETFVRTCDECKSRGCPERRRRAQTVTRMLPGRNPHGLFPGNKAGAV